jgi:DNA-binding MarR family transcriptional regulator
MWYGLGITDTKSIQINAPKIPAFSGESRKRGRVSMSKESSLKTISRRGDYLGFWLRVLSNGVSKTFEKSLESHGVTVAQWVVLRALYGQESSLNELSKAIGIDQGSTSRMVERLVQRQLLTRETPPENRRAVRITLTPAGVNLVPKLASAADANEELFFGKISEAKKDQLLKTVLELIRKNDIPPTAFD